jgi:RNA polymerase sigma-70 factor (ECF subfamily)
MHVSDPTVPRQGSGQDVARARDGDAEAFRALVERHSRYLFGVAHRLTGNAQDAQDVVQETWLKVHMQLRRFEARSDVRTWLTRIAVNCSIDHIRARRHRETAHDPADLEYGPIGKPQIESLPAPDRLLLGVEIQTRVSETLACLTTLERAAFTLRHVEGMSIEEISSALGLKTSATKHSIFRAVRKMRAALAPFVEA